MNLNSSTPCAPSFSPYRPPLEKEAAFWLKYFFLPRDLFQFSQGDMGGGVGFRLVLSRGGESILAHTLFFPSSILNSIFFSLLQACRVVACDSYERYHDKGEVFWPHNFLFFLSQILFPFIPTFTGVFVGSLGFAWGLPWGGESILAGTLFSFSANLFYFEHVCSVLSTYFFCFPLFPGVLGVSVGFVLELLEGGGMLLTHIFIFSHFFFPFSQDYWVVAFGS